MALSPAAETLSDELSIIQKEALRARNIVRDLLFIVRPGTAESAEIPVTELIAHIERLRKTAWVQQGIHWRIDIEEPCKVWGNENQLTQVILNLVNNAEHALQGQPLRQISVHARSVGANTEIAVSDTGTGMDDATRGRVFEPFFTTKQGHGTGLGLPLSYSIVQAHGGEILVDSVIGQGTTFTLLLPSAPTVDQPAERTVEDHKEGTIRVLVVDDEPSLRKVCQRLIASMGHECVTAENSTAAAALAANQDFDVVLCDYRLAAETANDVVQALERVAPHLVSRIVIATGATTDPGVVELTERHGFPLIAKPYGREELGAAIQQRSQ
jgi:CheY-like chemotaxis protein